MDVSCLHFVYAQGACQLLPLPSAPALPQALLDEWRAELARKPLSMSEGEACRVLGLEAKGDGGAISEEELKAAYRRRADVPLALVWRL